MSRRAVTLMLIIGAGLLLPAAVAAVLTAPGSFPADTCTVKITGVKYLAKVKAEEGTMEEADPKRYRYAVVTFQLEKPANRDIALAAADLTLHYRRADGSYDIAPCEALGGFTTGKEEDRALQMPGFSGPGWVKINTGAATRRAKTIYAEAVFGKLEPSAAKLWLAIAQPVTPEYETKGWKP